MESRIALHIFYPDGGRPESGAMDLAELSPKWLSHCGELLEHFGPVLQHNMGSTLSHFDIRLAGPVGQLLCHQHLSYHFAISLGLDTEQDRAAVAQFARAFVEACRAAGSEPAPDLLQEISTASATPTLLLFDTCDPAIDDDDRGAQLQLANHLAGAYFAYSRSSPKKPDGPQSQHDS